jgi:hypothetical protein
MMIGPIVTRFASRLRYPTLFKLVAGLFVVDLFLPDFIPFLDEILLALGTLMLAGMRKRGTERAVIDGSYTSAR